MLLTMIIYSSIFDQIFFNILPVCLTVKALLSNDMKDDLGNGFLNLNDTNINGRKFEETEVEVLRNKLSKSKDEIDSLKNIIKIFKKSKSHNYDCQS